MTLVIVGQRDPFLRHVLEPFDFANPPCDPTRLAVDLVETMLGGGHLALSASHVQCPWRVFVIASSPIIACFNPRVVDSSTQTQVLEETDAAFPGMLLRVERPKRVKTRFALPNGEVLTRVFEGMTAALFQQMLDHLNGVCFVDRVSRYHREKALRDQRLTLRAAARARRTER